MTTPFSPSLVLVTGASSGIGHALCHLLADLGVSLLITGRDTKKLELLANALKDRVEVTYFPADILQSEGRQAIVEHIHKKVPDLVINNAGFGLYGDAISYSTQEQEGVLIANGNAVLEFTLEAAKALRSRKKKGVICNIASVAAFQVGPSMAVYSASKAFVVKMSKALDFELAPEGIRVLVSCPGMVETQFAKRAGGEYQGNRFLVMSSEFAAKEIWQQIQKQKRCHLFDWKYRVMVALTALLPESISAKIIQKSISARLNGKG